MSASIAIEIFNSLSLAFLLSEVFAAPNSTAIKAQASRLVCICVAVAATNVLVVQFSALHDFLSHFLHTLVGPFLAASSAVGSSVVIAPVAALILAALAWRALHRHVRLDVSLRGRFKAWWVIVAVGLCALGAVTVLLRGFNFDEVIC